VYLEAERAARCAETVRRQVSSLERVAETVQLRVSDGRELPVEAKRAALNLARSRQRLQTLDSDRAYAESSLGALLGFDDKEQVRVVVEDRTPAPLPADEEAGIEAAVANSKELRRLESALTAKGFEIRAQKAAKLPRVDLVAQYAVLGRFNNYAAYFSKFQRNNAQLGVSFQIPLFAGPAVDALVSQSSTESARLRLEMRTARNRIALDSRRFYQQVKQAEGSRDIARLDLEVARDQLSVLLAQMEEGRTSLRQVEEARLTEDDKWMAFIDSNYTVETARLNLLRQTGDLLASLQ
jgi:outer membrane protein TolC